VANSNENKPQNRIFFGFRKGTYKQFTLIIIIIIIIMSVTSINRSTKIKCDSLRIRSYEHLRKSTGS
jgi:hypothetical protein